MTDNNEVQLGNNIYVFATSSMAAAFTACLMKNTIGYCKLDFPPQAIRTVPEKPDPSNTDDD